MAALALCFVLMARGYCFCKPVAERVDPEVVEQFRVTGGDVAGHSLVEPELAEQPEPGGQTLFAVQPLFLDRAVLGERRDFDIGRRHGPEVTPGRGPAVVRHSSPASTLVVCVDCEQSAGLLAHGLGGSGGS